MKKEYEVIIDRSSAYIHVVAKSEEEAESLARKLFEKKNVYEDYEWWVAECTEVDALQSDS
jgi:hypothetical protein